MSDDVVKIGVLTDMSGVYADVGGKGAVLAMSRQLAMEGGPFGIRVNTISPALSPEAALALVLNKDGVKGALPVLTGTDASLKRWSYDGAAFSGEPVTVQLVYQPVNDRLQLAWNVAYYSANGTHWWNVRVDATTGAELCSMPVLRPPDRPRPPLFGSTWTAGSDPQASRAPASRVGL